jgi:hypothetical protein
MASGETPPCSSAPLIAAAPNCGAGTPESAPKKLPIGVRAAETTYTGLFMVFEFWQI